ncbi:MAG TPA: GNAT family N-acetyltransferase [Prolixibacteraceae bacterium]|jgi:phosphinothricin acetyltransferase
MEYRISPCTENQLPEILEILNEAILHSTALYDYKPRTMDNMKTWYMAKQHGNFPVIGLFDIDDTLLGFSSYGSFRNWPAYKYTVEHSIYIRSDRRGQGLGTILLKEIIKSAEEQDYHVLIGGIDASNNVSIQLHEKEGFIFCGTINHAGFKFGKWLNLSFYQLILKTPEYPEEDKY